MFKETAVGGFAWGNSGTRDGLTKRWLRCHLLRWLSHDDNSNNKLSCLLRVFTVGKESERAKVFNASLPRWPLEIPSRVGAGNVLPGG